MAKTITLYLMNNDANGTIKTSISSIPNLGDESSHEELLWLDCSNHPT
jgi:hypothetical protein